MCYQPITLINKHRNTKSDSHVQTFGCGKCLQCINKIRTSWAFRLYQEAKTHHTAYLLTPTYDPENLPYLNVTTGEYPTTIQSTDNMPEDILEPIVYKKHIQDFIKQIRKRTSDFVKKYGQYKDKNHLKQLIKEDYKIRYYCTSEYGTKQTKRPHYHLIIFNLQPPIARQIELQKVWKYGDIQIKPIDNDVKTYYYLTKYLFKQRNWNIWNFRPFTLMSTKPFIGYNYLNTHKNYHLQKQNLFTTFNDKQIIIPRIYSDRLPKLLKDNTNKELEKILKEQEIKQFNHYNQGKNHHPDLLKWYKQETQQINEQIENQLFINKFIET